MLNSFSKFILQCAEHFYLSMHGWQKLGSNYVPPIDFPFKKHPSYGRVHAVNAQRQVK